MYIPLASESSLTLITFGILYSLTIFMHRLDTELEQSLLTYFSGFLYINTIYFRIILSCIFDLALFIYSNWPSVFIIIHH